MIHFLPMSTLFPYTTLFRSAFLLVLLATITFAVVVLAGNQLQGTFQDVSYELSHLTDASTVARSEEHTSELQSQFHLVCRLLLEKKKRRLKSLQKDVLFSQC